MLQNQKKLTYKLVYQYLDQINHTEIHNNLYKRTGVSTHVPLEQRRSIKSFAADLAR